MLVYQRVPSGVNKEMVDLGCHLGTCSGEHPHGLVQSFSPGYLDFQEWARRGWHVTQISLGRISL